MAKARVLRGRQTCCAKHPHNRLGRRAVLQQIENLGREVMSKAWNGKRMCVCVGVRRLMWVVMVERGRNSSKEAGRAREKQKEC